VKNKTDNYLIRVHTGNVIGTLEYRWVEGIGPATLHATRPTAAASSDRHPEGWRPVPVLSIQFVQTRHCRGAQERVVVIARAWRRRAAATRDEASDTAQVWCGTRGRSVAPRAGADEASSTSRRPPGVNEAVGLGLLKLQKVPVVAVQDRGCLSWVDSFINCGL